MAKLFIWNRTTKRTEEVRGSCAFVAHGERFAAHRDIGNPEQWRVTHIGTGGAVGPAVPTREAALTIAKVKLQNMAPEVLRAAVERFHASLKIEIAKAQEEERRAQKRREERKAKAAAKRAARKVSEMSREEVRAVFQQAAGEAVAALGDQLRDGNAVQD